MKREIVIRFATLVVIIFAFFMLCSSAHEILYAPSGESRWRPSGDPIIDVLWNPLYLDPIMVVFYLFVLMGAIGVFKKRSWGFNVVLLALSVYCVSAVATGLGAVSDLGGLAEMGKSKLVSGTEPEFNQLVVSPLNDLKKQVLWKMAIQLIGALSLFVIFFSSKKGGIAAQQRSAADASHG